MEKKEFSINKKVIIGFTALFIVIVGLLSCLIYNYYNEYQQAMAKNAALNGQVAALQEQVEELEEQVEEDEAVVEAMAEAQAKIEEETLAIPFTVNLDDWKYVLVNELHPLSQDFEPQLEKTRDGQNVDKRMRGELEAMIDAAKEEGMNLLICSSYRDYKKQDSLMDKSIAKFVKQGMDYRDAFFKTKEQIALTGASEHHTGLAVDIVGRNHQSLDAAQADTKEAKWLNEHAHEYGFILRYPADKEETTMISFESWHYRYVGKKAAAFMKENNLCLEEFVELAQKQVEEKEDLQVRAAG